MENFRELNKEQKKNWLKGVVALNCLQKPLERFVDEEMETFHRELGSECGPDHCVKKCDFNSWKPRPNQSPPLDCDVCSRWKDVILTNHTSQHGKVMWLNCKPHRWSREKWEVAKVYMPDGHKNHNSVGDFDIAALLCLMRQCKHFKQFELGGLCEVSNVRNKIMHAPRNQLEQKDLQDYFNQIRELGEKLAKHVPEFKSLSEDIDQIQNLDFRLILLGDIEAQKNQTKDEKELENLYFALAAECQLTRMKLEKLERQIAQQKQDHLAVAQREIEHLYIRKELDKLKIQMAQQEQDELINCYALTHKPRGLCVIINNEKFLGQSLCNRPGSQQDERALDTVFTRLGFKVVTHNNLTAGAMRRELQQLGSRNFLDDDALVVCVLSHGLKGCVFGTEGQTVSLRELTKPFTSREAPTLAGKPKLFFIQACQETVYQNGPVSAGYPGSMPHPLRPRQEEGDRRGRLEEDEGRVHRESVPCDDDFLLGMATLPESWSFRNPVEGYVYIQELCTQLTRAAESSGKADILDVLTHVNREVSQREFLYYKQMPEPKNTLNKKLVLKFV